VTPGEGPGTLAYHGAMRPESGAGDTVESLRARIADLEEQLERAEERTLDSWLDAITSSVAGSTTVAALQSSFSWRITRPLRAVKIVYDRARIDGVARTARLVRQRLALIRQARRRG
jgi:hypothetical protein